MTRAIVVISGGMDSVTLAHVLRDQALDLHFVSFDYGQRHVKELDMVQYWASEWDVPWDVVDLSSVTKLLAGSGSVLVDHEIDVPDGHYAEATMKATVVPNRNAIMLSIATGIAVAQGASFVAAGMHAGDHFIYPDCRPQFIRSFNQSMQLANDGFWGGGKIVAPFIEYTKADIVETGVQRGVDYEMTWSCYKGGEKHCGTCGTCVERKEAFQLAQEVDPTDYE